MNFSEYTLVSFGDSFTFGQDIVQAPPYHYDRDKFIKEKLYKEECNDKAYTQVVADRLGFKDSINFGVLGSSNDRSTANLESFLRNNPKKKVFVLFNFTSSSRYVQFFKVDGENEYDVVDMTPGFDGWKTDHNHWKTDHNHDYTGINSKTISQNWTYFRNTIQEVYNHIKQRRAVYYILSSYDVPYVTFDVLNDMDYRILRDNPLQYISNRNIDGCYSSLLYNDDENYVFKEMDFLKAYYQELVDNTPLLKNHLIKLKLNNYIWKIGIDRYDDKNHYMTDNGHWNSEGHIEVAKLIEKFINERYK
jgi:hypothetical protein